MSRELIPFISPGWQGDQGAEQACQRAGHDDEDLGGGVFVCGLEVFACPVLRRAVCNRAIIIAVRIELRRLSATITRRPVFVCRI